MKIDPRPFVGETLFSVRDLELSNPCTVLGYESERGFVLVRFADGVPRALPVASLVRAVDDSRVQPEICQGEIWAEAKDFADYLVRMGEAESISKKEQHK